MNYVYRIIFKTVLGFKSNVYLSLNYLILILILILNFQKKIKKNKIDIQV